MIRYVTDLDSGIKYGFSAKTPYEAMRKMIYTLNISGKCNAKINKTESGKHLYVEHNEHTYVVRNK